VKILLAHNFYKNPGGEDQCVAAETGLLTSHGHDVMHYFVSNEATDGLRRADLALRTLWSFPAYRQIRALIRDRRPDVVHFHNTFPLISPGALHAVKAESIPVVQTLHNYRLLCANALLFRDGKPCEDCLGRIPWRAVGPRCYRGSRSATTAVVAMLSVHRLIGTWRSAVDAYIAPSEFARQKFIQGGLPADQIAVKPNFAYPDPGAGNGCGGYAVYVGRLSFEKGIDTILAAWKLLGGTVPLKIAGDGPQASAVMNACSRDSAIEWLRDVPHEHVYDLIGGAAVLILPSECYEGALPRVVIEAFAKATPVIAADLGAMTGTVGHGNGLRFLAGDPADLASKVRFVFSKPDRLRQMRRGARETFETSFSAESNYEMLTSIYARAIDSCRSRARASLGLETA